MQARSTDVVIVGGGVIGCAIAYYLCQQQIDVILLERGEIGGQASGAAAGLLAPLGPLSGPGPFADLLLEGFARLIALIPELEERSGIHLGYKQTGALRTVRNPRRIAHLQKRLKRWQALSLQVDWCSGDEARRREPLLSADVCAAIWVPEESHIQAPCVVQAFAQAARRMGARILTQQEASRIEARNSRVVAVTTAQGERFSCEHLILAAGAWAAQSSAWLGISLPVQPLHGQLVAFPQTAQPLTHIIFGDAIYLIPKGERILVGATKEERGFDRAVTDEGISWLTTMASRLLPDLQGMPVQAAWAGLRPHTPDSQPILGSLASWNNVLIAAGHNSVGVILSALTGSAIADLLVTKRVHPLIQPFSPARFIEY